MKKYIQKLFVGSLMAGTLLVSSCASDYLDTAPTDSTGSADAIGTTDNAIKALNGIAKLMSTQHYYFGQGFAGENNIIAHYENYPSENYLYNLYASGWSPIHNQEFHTRTNSIYDAYAWYYYYSIVGNANTILANIDNAEGTESEKQFIKASALTFRAYAFEKLVHYYCWRWQDSNNGASQGLILRLDESTNGMPYSTLAETYTQIYKDLDEAISLYGESGMNRKEGDVWMPNVNVAHAIYARAALTKQDYAKALSEAKLAREGYPLMNNTEYYAGFCNPTGEWIMGSFGGSQENNWYWSYGVQFACNGYYASTQQTGAGAIGRELINRIPNNDARKALFLTEDKFPGYNFNDGSVMDLTYGILGMGEKEKEADALWDEAAAYCKKMAVSGLTAPYEAGYMYLGGQLKFYVFDTPGVGYLPFIRSSEMVLIEAEANYFLNNEAAAQAALVELNATSGRNAAIGRELINRIPNNDARKALFLTEDKFPGYNFNDGSVMDLTYGILGMGEKEKEADALWDEAAAYCKKMAVSGLTAPYEAGYMYLGGQLKFYVFDTPGVGYLPFIRSSEMVLIEAEANYFLNNEAAAQAALVELNATSGRNAEYTCNKTGDALWNEIMDYRELELWGEGFAWSDYKRWNRDVIRNGFDKGGNAHISIATTIPASGANKWTWDVPLNETDYNDELKVSGN